MTGQPEIQLAVPTAEQAASYRECMRFQGLRFAERGKGRSGYLSEADEAANRYHGQIVDTALSAGVGFDIEAA